MEKRKKGKKKEKKKDRHAGYVEKLEHGGDLVSFIR